MWEEGQIVESTNAIGKRIMVELETQTRDISLSKRWSLNTQGTAVPAETPNCTDILESPKARSRLPNDSAMHLIPMIDLFFLNLPKIGFLENCLKRLKTKTAKNMFLQYCMGSSVQSIHIIPCMTIICWTQQHFRMH